MTEQKRKVWTTTNRKEIGRHALCHIFLNRRNGATNLSGKQYFPQFRKCLHLSRKECQNCHIIVVRCEIRATTVFHEGLCLYFSFLERIICFFYLFPQTFFYFPRQFLVWSNRILYNRIKQHYNVKNGVKSDNCIVFSLF